MDSNGDLGIMSHVGRLWRTPEFVRGLWPGRDEKFFLAIVKLSQERLRKTPLRLL